MTWWCRSGGDDPPGSLTPVTLLVVTLTDLLASAVGGWWKGHQVNQPTGQYLQLIIYALAPLHDFPASVLGSSNPLASASVPTSPLGSVLGPSGPLALGSISPIVF